jgi:hypothetical protein
VGSLTAIGSIRLGSLFRTLPTRALTDQSSLALGLVGTSRPCRALAGAGNYAVTDTRCG